MMNKLLLPFILLCFFDNGALHAQLFGRPRTVGRPLVAGNGSAIQQENVGTVTGSERFLRGNRGRAAFVGADQRETQAFVGSEQARTSGTIISSTAGIDPPPDMSRQINQPLAPSGPREMYLPTIQLDIDDLPSTSIATGDPAATTRLPVAIRIRRATALVSPTGIGVSVEGRTAILTGLVRSDEERRLAETLASFEPGISQVRNLIQVQTPVSDRIDL